MELNCTQQNDFEKTIGRGSSNAIKQLRQDIAYYISKAEQILDRLTVPNKDFFLCLFKLEISLPVSKANKTSIALVFEERIDELAAEDRISAASNCRLGLRSFTRKKNYTLKILM